MSTSTPEKTLEIPKPREVIASPFGRVTVFECVHRGPLFTLYRAELNGRDVCLKTPSAALGVGSLFRGNFYQICHSEAFGQRSTGLAGLDDRGLGPEMLTQIASAMLVAEAQVIAWTGGHWNHSTLGVGVWSEQTVYGPDDPAIPFHLRFRPVMIMPWYDATPLARLSDAEKLELFPRMLPALFAALTARYHGDLSESNILVAQDRTKFHIVDPGVIVTSSIERVPDSSIFEETDDQSFFTTAPANYALLRPFQDGLYTHAGESGEPRDLTALLSWLVGPLPQFGLVNGGVEPAVPSSGLSRNPEWSAPRLRPYPSDLLALGVMYYRVLTGEDLFFDRWMGLDRPAWVGDLPSGAGPTWRKGDVVDRYARIVSVLEDGYVGKRVAASGKGARERTVAEALISLTIEDADHLRRLLA